MPKIMTDEKEVSEAFIDGYVVGDRLLEGVMFKVVVKDDKLVCVGWNAESNIYMQQFSKSQIEKWKEEIVDYDDCMTTSDNQDAWFEPWDTAVS